MTTPKTPNKPEASPAGEPKVRISALLASLRPAAYLTVAILIAVVAGMGNESPIRLIGNLAIVVYCVFMAVLTLTITKRG